ncbi:MAG: multidrug ABC transporter ATP-binding protein [Halobacteriovoraceae bacterium]|nr:multidrug ABC transporter ATP-binding protein [Halobacteriovoraceae bacterium]|tara:strand:- start:7699 stop:8709 length:1011 start_codon:yes stop_codon:yes gene_type:complete
MTAPLIQTQNLGKQFVSFKKLPGVMGSFTSFFKRNPIIKNAVEDFTFTVKAGEIVGLLGPNGAGKTTLMKMFTGIIVPSHGELKILGHNPWERDKALRKKMALVMGQKSQLWWDIPAMDSFLLLQKYYEISDEQFEERISKMSELLGVKDLLHIHVRKLSLGERMKMELMASLLHNPDVIFLDEPTIGLDLVAQENIRHFIKQYHEENQCCIIITSHYMQDVQALCDRLVLIFDGKKSFDGPIEEFEHILGHEKSVTFNFSCPQDPKHSFFSSLNTKWNEELTQLELRIEEARLREVSAQMIQDFPVEDFQTEKLPIERVMKELMNNPDLLRKKSP